MLAYDHLDESGPQQFGLSLSRLLHNDWGYSLISGVPVSQLVSGALPSTLALASTVLVVAVQFEAYQIQIALLPLALTAATRLFEVGGSSASSTSLALDRHWRNIRTIAAHNPKTLKAVAVGNYALNGTPPPNQGFF